ncbi:MAG: hypothetical protein BZY80_00745 [SAR202 cluster bacterium Io17-Chloro-G2]|nr:MAG: hypothetical protein BZY80_00745 [SAR202 cluster bacterium Io17-Chloro-G2]
MDYRQSIGALLSLVDHERNSLGPRQKAITGLSRTERFMSRLGDPHRQAKTIHVAGTKGKGSTAAMCDAALRAAGYHTGFYSSPHLHHFTERIRLDSQPIAEEDFARLVDELWPRRMDGDPDSSDGAEAVTLFEFMTGMAYYCFAKEKVDFQVIEVGLGGRLDATNVVTPSVAVITSISLDHTAILGDTLAEIAAEKAGIIKPGGVVAVAPQAPEALSTILGVCRDQQARAIQIGKDVTWVSHETGRDPWDSQRLTVKGRLEEYQLDIPLAGLHQLENAATAVAALEALVEQGHSVPAEAIQRGFAQVSWPGRMEVLSRSPLFLADGAHNPHSVNLLMEALDCNPPPGRLILVAGFSRDKNVADMARRLAQASPMVFATRSRHPRSLPPAAVADLFKNEGLTAVESDSVAEAVEQALGLAGPGGLVLATGSLFVVAEAREAMLGIEPEVYPDILPQDLR